MNNVGWTWLGKQRVYQDNSGQLWIKFDPNTGERYDEPVVPFDGDVYKTKADCISMTNRVTL